MINKSFLSGAAGHLLSIIALAAVASPAASPAQDSATAPVPALQPAVPVAPPTATPIRILNDSIPHPATGVLELRASIASRTLTVVRGDTLLGQYAVAVGADDHPTPRGEFFIKRIVWNPSWHPPDADWARGKSPKEPGSAANPMKIVKIFFQEPDYYIHGTDALESLGKAASHGCLRMYPEQAAEVAKLVMEHGGQPREENWFWRVLHFRRETKTVYLDNPIRFVISD